MVSCKYGYSKRTPWTHSGPSMRGWGRVVVKIWLTMCEKSKNEAGDGGEIWRPEPSCKSSMRTVKGPYGLTLVQIRGGGDVWL